jgi:glycosyltransferase involved in cell wall biosynthesis
VDKVRVLHLIDSLALGGAERVAVNLCNALAAAGCEAHLCATRTGGPMATFVEPEVGLLLLDKKKTLDGAAILRLRRYVREHSIQVIHAHSSSFFLACVMKMLTGVRVVWHDHFGDSENLEQRRALAIIALSFLFDGVVSVNEKLRKWATLNLHVSGDKICFLPNFPALSKQREAINEGLVNEKKLRLVCTANLRKQKDHATLIRALQIIRKDYPDIELLLVGADYEDDYSTRLKALIRELGLGDNVGILGCRTDVAAILEKCDIGVLSSESEGLPVSLLEYGLAGLPVVCTAVGDCAMVLGNGEFGRVVLPKGHQALAVACLDLLCDEIERKRLGGRFQEHVERHYSAQAVAKQVIDIYLEILL